MEEPSVLDLLKAKIKSIGQRRTVEPPVSQNAAEVDLSLTGSGIDQPDSTQSKSPSSSALDTASINSEEPTEKKPAPSGRLFNFPWKILTGLIFALIAQALLEPPNRSVAAAVSLYGLAAFLVIAAVLTHEWQVLPLPEEPIQIFSLKAKRNPLLISLPLLLFAFLTMGGNRFTLLNLFLWISGSIFFINAFWESDPDKPKFWQRVKNLFHWDGKVRITGWVILLIASSALVLFFRFYQISQVPGEMFSDHAEKLLDVGDILNGQYSIFFPRNTGREAVQMYLTAAIAVICGTGLSFLSLKIGTVLAGVLTLPYIYLLGKRMGNKWVGLFALLLAGVAYWPNVISRVGLRFPLYPLFVAPVLFYLIRGLQRTSRNDFILAGIFLGIGLHGYSPMRIVPFVVVIGVALYLLHRQSRGNRIQTIWALVILALVSFVVFLPLFRYVVENPDSFASRAFSRVGDTERALPGPVLQIFLDNSWKAFIMPFYDNGQIWVHSIPGRPALDVVSAALYLIGFVVVLIRYIKTRNWADLFLLLSIPLLMLPSTLSLAFPDENPSLNRTGGALIPIFIIAGIGLEGVLSNLRRNFKSTGGLVVVVMLGLGLLGWTSANNYELVINQFSHQFLLGAWNTSDIGMVIRGFTQSIGSPDNAHVVPYPYWVDTRLVGINAGFPERDYALWPENFDTTLEVTAPQLFIVHPQDTESLATLESMYPDAVLSYYDDQYDGKDFYILLVP